MKIQKLITTLSIGFLAVVFTFYSVSCGQDKMQNGEETKALTLLTMSVEKNGPSLKCVCANNTIFMHLKIQAETEELKGKCCTTSDMICSTLKELVNTNTIGCPASSKDQVEWTNMEASEDWTFDSATSSWNGVVKTKEEWIPEKSNTCNTINHCLLSSKARERVCGDRYYCNCPTGQKCKYILETENK